jgi:hypothetical protein
MSGTDASTDRRERTLLRFGSIVVVGGGCYGSYYVRQLTRARRANAVTWNKVLVIDRDPSCRVAAECAASRDAAEWNGVELVPQGWEPFFREYFARAAANPEQSRLDAIVPSPLMPHLMLEWVKDRARQRWPRRTVHSRPLARTPDVPWQRAAPNGAHFVSFAEWMCPINCIEPARCPHTKGPRSWSLPDTAREYVEQERRIGRALAGPVIFHCTHRAYGVGMFDTWRVLEADDFVRTVAERDAAEILVGTMSHCHGVFEVLAVGAAHPGSVGRDA